MAQNNINRSLKWREPYLVLQGSILFFLPCTDDSFRAAVVGLDEGEVIAELDVVADEVFDGF